MAAAFANAAAASRALDGLEVAYDPLDRETALAAGIAWQRYRLAGGTRRRILPDLLIGVHAMSRAERLLTRDGGFYHSAFESLAILDPSS